MTLFTQAGKCLFAINRLHSSALDVIVAAVEHFPDLGQFLEITGQSVLYKFFFGASGLRRPFVQLGFKIGAEMYFNRV